MILILVYVAALQNHFARSVGAFVWLFVCLAVCLFVCLFVCFQCCHLNERLQLCVIVHGNCGAKVQHQRLMHSCVLVKRPSLRCQLYMMTVRTGGVRSALPTCTKHIDNA